MRETPDYERRIKAFMTKSFAELERHIAHFVPDCVAKQNALKNIYSGHALVNEAIEAQQKQLEKGE